MKTLLKPTIRVKLIPNIKHVPLPNGRFETYRPQGPDTWSVELRLCDTEGHKAHYRFTSSRKSEALADAYTCLRKHTTNLWFPAFYNEEAVKYEDVLVQMQGAADRFNESMDLVEQGKRTKEEHLELWAARMALLERTGAMLPAPTNREHVLPQDPPKKWKWYHWFWNPEGVNK